MVGDVSDKGVPAALVMASTHAILRAEATRLVAPAEVLGRANELLVADTPAAMFATCLYAVLDPASGRLRFANAGHGLPYLRTEAGVTELRATGMPLGLLPGMRYEERTAELPPGAGLLFHSDGLVEAHGPDREMFGMPRLAGLGAGGRHHPGHPGTDRSGPGGPPTGGSRPTQRAGGDARAAARGGRQPLTAAGVPPQYQPLACQNDLAASAVP